MNFDDPENATTEPRKDIVATQSASLSLLLERAARTDSSYVPPASRNRRRVRAKADKRFAARKEFLEPLRSDPNGFERIIGDSDLMSINFLDRGKRAAAAVAGSRFRATAVLGTGQPSWSDRDFC